MSLVKAPALGIERFASGLNKENWNHASDSDKRTIFAPCTSRCWAGNT
jgi:hypothetical protein